ncbi:MAG: uroporphyrinogen-III C-methyltransferase [Proteobacteria bacterium]|nr:uroporphyrinogen-III C-methyltransferase [Pseudomonadota bacterium]
MSDTPDDNTPAAKPAKPGGRPTGLAAVAIIVALVALAVAAWSTWRLQRTTQAGQAAGKQTAAAIASLESQLAANNQQLQASTHRLSALESGLDDARSTAQGLNRRIANLETAYTNLSGQQQSGRDTLLLNDAEMLLRNGQQRYDLFHDSTGALKAYSQAIEVLAQVQNPAYAPVRASATTERDALAASVLPSRQTALDTLSALRGKVPALPLAEAGTAASASSSAKPGFWSRLAGSFSGIVRVSRENGKAAPLTDPRLARQTLALDLAQAQESLLAFDTPDYRTALRRADTTLAAQFDGNDPGVKEFGTQLQDLLAQHAPGPAPQLGGALAQLQSLRASQPPAPASAASSGATKP